MNNPIWYNDIKGDTQMVTKNGILVFDNHKQDGNVFHLNKDYKSGADYSNSSKLIKDAIQITSNGNTVAKKEEVNLYVQSLMPNAGLSPNEFKGGISITNVPTGTSESLSIGYSALTFNKDGTMTQSIANEPIFNIKYHTSASLLLKDYYNTVSSLEHEKRHKDQAFAPSQINKVFATEKERKHNDAASELDAINYQKQRAAYGSTTLDFRSSIQICKQTNQAKFNATK